MADVDIPPTEPFSSSPPVHIISAEEARFRKKIRKAIAQQQAILDQKAPEASWKPLDREKTITTWSRQLAPYQRQLRKSFDRYIIAKRKWQAAEKSLWQRMTGNTRKLEKRADALFYKFLEVLRFVVQALLYIVGLRSEPPQPIRSVLSEKSKPALDHFKKTYDAEFSAMADPQKLEPWLNRRFERLALTRQQRIEKWDEDHKVEKFCSRQKIERLSAMLITKQLTTHYQFTRNIYNLTINF
ncbi:hypothetical protein [Acetobacter indonesiensis]|uniref:hypothetical protein n=1 Tax=Acetobacter indonesiensis TaxID=104101 RepID=UPI001FD5F6B6|nr:hypothetical protein [Acetobacter indonesiensis]